MKKIIALLLALSMVLAMSACEMLDAVQAAQDASAAEPAPAMQKDLVVLYTNDVHCGIEKGVGYPAVAAMKKQLEAEGNYVLLVDNGDSIQGEPIGTISKGKLPHALMEAVGYDLAIPGNHEFDYGMDNFLEIAADSAFPYICCNLRYKGEPVFEPYKIFDFDGVKIAFVGVDTPKTITSSTPVFFQDEEGNFVYDFCQDDDGSLLYSTVQASVDAARAEGAKYVILMAHLGIEAECIPYTSSEVVVNTSGIDAVLDGHSHSVVECERIRNKEGKWVLVSQTGTKLGSVGMMVLTTDGKLSTGLVTVTDGSDEAVTAKIAEINADLDKELSKVVAHTDVALTIADPETDARIIRNQESNLGDLCADAYLNIGNADIAFVNGGGIRVTIKAGDITNNDILTVHPFGNVLTVVEVTGQQVLDALEWGSRVTPSETGGFLQVAGLTYEIHTYLPNPCTQDENGLFTGVEGERRVKNVMVGDEPIDPEKTYKLASHDYMLLNQGDGFAMFAGAVKLDAPEIPDNQVLITYIVDKLGGVVGEEYAEPFGQGRIKLVEEAPAA